MQSQKNQQNKNKSISPVQKSKGNPGVDQAASGSNRGPFDNKMKADVASDSHADNTQRAPQEINLPTGQKTQVAKEVYGGGQRPARENTEHRQGQVGVDPSSSPRRPLDDDYLANPDSDSRMAGSDSEQDDDILALDSNYDIGPTDKETARESSYRSDSSKKENHRSSSSPSNS